MSHDFNLTPIAKGIDSRELRLRLDEDRRAGARIKVVGVGGGGSNAVSRMVQAGISGVMTMAVIERLQPIHVQVCYANR